MYNLVECIIVFCGIFCVLNDIRKCILDCFFFLLVIMYWDSGLVLYVCEIVMCWVILKGKEKVVGYFFMKVKKLCIGICV